MSQPSIQQIAGIRPKGDTEGVNTPGAFTAFDDDTAVFCGNGEVTAAQATGHYINLLAAKERPLAPFSDNPSAATFCAQLMLQQNQQLKGMTPETAVPPGELLHLDGVRLKDLLARIDPGQLKSALAAMQGDGPVDPKAGGKFSRNVSSIGLKIPID